MRKKIAIAGAIVLIVGIAIFGVSLQQTFANTTVGTQMSQHSNGEWASNEINISSGNKLTLITNASDFGVIPAKDLSSLTSGNLNSYELTPTGNTSTSSGSVYVYSPNSGSYYIVAFAGSSPSVTYTTASSLGAVAAYGIFLIVGVILGFAGFIVLIVGLVLKRKDNPLHQQI